MKLPTETNYTSSDTPTYPLSVITLRWIGYVMLLLFFMDVVTLVYPPDLMNPNWEFQTVGNIVDRIVIPVMGLGFILFGEEKLRKPLELLFVKCLSWFLLLVSVVFIILIPLILTTSAQRIAAQIDNNFGEQYQEQISQSQLLQEQIESASSTDLEALIANQAEGSSVGSPEEAREELLNNLAQARQELQLQVQGEINQRKIVVRKNAVKWILGSFVSGVLFAYMWRLTRWARISPTGTMLGIFRGTKKSRL